MFDISFPCTADFLEPVQGEKRIIVFNTEADFDVRTARTGASTTFPNYRYFTVAGGPHIPDTPCTRMFFHQGLNPRNPAPPVEGSTPMDWTPFIRALFVAGDKWVREGTEPSRSLVLKVNPGNLIANDGIGNAIGGIRHPALSLKEATFIASIIRVRLTEPVGNARGWALFGAYSRPKRLADIPDYATLFRNFTNGLVGVGLLLPEDRDVLIKRALLPPPPGGQPGTYTINYMRKQFPSPTPTAEECGTTSPVPGRDEETFEPTPIALDV